MNAPEAATALLVIAKAPAPGRVKTRLCPPCSPEEAAALASAALADTLETAAATPARQRVLVLEGEPGPWLPPGFRVVPQRPGPFDERLAGAFEDGAGGGPALLIGMDTPQVTPSLLAASARALHRPGTGAVLGRAPDGGWWAIGLHRPDPAVFLGVPMSQPVTGAVQQERLAALGLAPAPLPPLRDVDDFDDALAVAGAAPGTRFGAAVAALAVTAGTGGTREGAEGKAGR